MNFYDNVNNLVSSFKQTEEYKEYKMLKERLKSSKDTYDMFKDFKIRPEIDCEWHKMLFEDALIVMNMMKQENNELFKQYLDSCFSISPKEEKEEY